MRRKCLSLSLRAAVLLAALPVSVHAQDTEAAHHYVSPWRTPWTYEQADHWAEMDTQYAACNGKEQSPIDIRHPQKAQLPALKFEYRSAPVPYLNNNGHTVRVNYPAPGSGDFIIVGEKRFQLTQFHFHRPSEEYVHGKPYDMVIHLMHQASDGEVVGVAVLLKSGRANAAIGRLWAHMPKSEGDEEVRGLEVDPADLLPHDLRYYRYRGSQTAPPCKEGVTWYVLKTPEEISPAQIEAFAELYPHDVRPVQPLNGRVVEESE